MGLFDKIFKSERDIAKEEISNVPWKQLSSIEQLDEIELESEKHTVAIFKHSTSCGISRMVLRMFESDYKSTETDEIKLYFLDLLNHHDISNEITARFGVRHESPQLLVIKNREVVHHSSHQAISAAKLQDL